MRLSTLCFFVPAATAFTVVPRTPPHVTTTTSLFMSAKVGVFFGTSTGSTEEVADLLVEALDCEGPFDVDDGDSVVEAFSKYDALIVGTPTWNTGADTERSGTGWDELYYGSMEDLQLNGKKVAVFGLGDSVSYAENYSDAAGELYDVFEKLGCTMNFGHVSQEGYLHEDSKSIRGDKFCGLLLDAVNQEELTEERVSNWVAQLTQEGFLEEGSSGGGEAAPATTDTHLNPPDSFMTEETSPIAAMDEMVGQLEEQNALLKQQLSEGSALLNESIGGHNTGFQPHTNAKTGKTMWTSPDGRTCYYTAGTLPTGTATVTKQSTGFSA